MTRYTMKFGGTSVGSPESISSVVDIVTGEVGRGNEVVVVVSAMSGVTDMLIRSILAAERGDKWEYQSLNQKIRDKHEEVLNLLVRPSSLREEVQAQIDRLLQDHLELCNAVNILRDKTSRIMDECVSYGERLSSRVVAAVISDNGAHAQQIDATRLLRTNDRFQDADPIWEPTRQQVSTRLIPILENGKIPVVTGFIGATEDDVVTTLGRGGSDYSAAIIAACNGSDELVIWTDVDGVMTTDPRLDKRACVLPQVSYQEVGELAFYGAKVLHPKTVQPIVDLDMPVRVRNTFNPAHEGTLIARESAVSGSVIKAVTVVRDISLLTVSGRGMLGVPGIAGRTFMATARAGASILMISQSSSEQSFCFIVPEGKAADVKHEIETELVEEIAGRDVDAVAIQNDVVIVTAVGAGMRGTPGIAGRVFSQMGSNGVNVLSIAQGSSECSISFAVSTADAERAVVLAHDLALESVQA
jgi:aspartokinase/homoserine dehydrogenase 1